MSDATSTTSVDLSAPAFAAHEGGKLEVRATKPLRDKDDLSLLYTPGVADVCLGIAADPQLREHRALAAAIAQRLDEEAQAFLERS